jgi:hypothetical protein
LQDSVIGGGKAAIIRKFWDLESARPRRTWFMSAGATTVWIKDGAGRMITRSSDKMIHSALLLALVLANPGIAQKWLVAFLPSIPWFASVGGAGGFLGFFRQPTARQLEILAYGPNTGLPSFPAQPNVPSLSRRLLPWFTDRQRRRLAGVGSEHTADRSVRGKNRIRHQPGRSGSPVSAGSVPSLDRAVISITRNLRSGGGWARSSNT